MIKSRPTQAYTPVFLEPGKNGRHFGFFSYGAVSIAVLQKLNNYTLYTFTIILFSFSFLFFLGLYFTFPYAVYLFILFRLYVYLLINDFVIFIMLHVPYHHTLSTLFLLNNQLHSSPIVSGREVASDKKLDTPVS